MGQSAQVQEGGHSADSLQLLQLQLSCVHVKAKLSQDILYG